MAKRSLGDRLVGWLGRQPEIAGGDVPIARPAAAPAAAPAPAPPAAEDPVVAELKKQVGTLSTQLGTMTELANKAEARRVEEAVAARAKAWAARMVGPGVAKALPAEQATLEESHARAQRDDLDRPVEAGQKSRVQLLEASVDARRPHALFGRRLGAVPMDPTAPNQAGIGLVAPDPKAPDEMAEARAANDRWGAQAGLTPKARAAGPDPASA